MSYEHCCEICPQIQQVYSNEKSKTFEKTWREKTQKTIRGLTFDFFVVFKMNL